MSNHKIPCVVCGGLILPDTAERTGGKCMPCFQGSDRNSNPSAYALRNGCLIWLTGMAVVIVVAVALRFIMMWIRMLLF